MLLSQLDPLLLLQLGWNYDLMPESRFFFFACLSLFSCTFNCDRCRIEIKQINYLPTTKFKNRIEHVNQETKWKYFRNMSVDCLKLAQHLDDGYEHILISTIATAQSSGIASQNRRQACSLYRCLAPLDAYTCTELNGWKERCKFYSRVSIGTFSW